MCSQSPGSLIHAGQYQPLTPTGTTHLCGCHQSLPQNNQDCLIVLKLASMRNSYIVNVGKFKDPFISQKNNYFLPCYAHYFSLHPGHGRTLRPVDFTEVFVKIHFRSSIRYFFSSLTIGLTSGFVSIKHSLKHRKS